MNVLRRFPVSSAFAICLLATTCKSAVSSQVPKNRQAQPVPQRQAPTVEQIVLGQLSYFRERSVSFLLREAQDDLKQGQTTQALRSLQSLLNRDEDRFVWSQAEKKLISLRRLIDRIFEEIPKDDLDQYHRLYAVAAQKLFEKARVTENLATMRDVRRRYFHTPAGFRAVDYLASYSFDRGEFLQASHYWLLLLESREHRSNVTDSVLLKCLASLKYSGREKRTASLSARIGHRRLKLGRRTIEIDDWIKSQRLKAEQTQASEIWPVALGNIHRNRSSQGSLPYWKPHWSIPFETRESEQVSTILETWQAQQQQRSLPFAVVNSAVAVGELVFVRDYLGISAIDITSGKKIWFYPCETSLAKSVLGENVDRYSSGIFSPQEYHTGAMGNSIFGTLSVDDKRVYFVDGGGMALPSYRNYRQRGRVIKNAQTDGSVITEGNSLLALQIAKTTDSKSQKPKPLWKLEGKKGTLLQGAYFLGPPLPVDHRLFVVVELEGVLKLACIGATDGKLLWLQGIARVEQPIRRDGFRHGLACTLAYSNGVIVCPTQTGLLVGVNADTGSLLWCRYCSDELEERRSNRASGIDRDNRGHAGFLSVPMIDGSQVVYLPPQSMKVQSYDLFTGDELWRVPREDGEYIGAAHRRSALLVGRRTCRALALKTGSDLWNLAIETPSGVGVHLGSNYLLPLQSGRFSLIDLKTGKSQVLLKSLFEKQSYIEKNDPQSNEIPKVIYPENLLVTKNFIVSAGAQRVTAYFKSRTLLEAIEKHPERLVKSPNLRLQVAELKILNRDDEDATRNLENLLAEKNLPNEIKSAAKKLLLDLIFQKLSHSGSNADDLIAELEKLSKSTQDRLEFYIHKSQWQQRTRQFSKLIDSLATLTTYSQSQPIRWNDDPTHLVSTSQWVADLSHQMYEKLDEKTRRQLMPKVWKLSRRTLKSKNDEDLSNFLTLFDRWPEANAVREKLALRLLKKSRHHRAEMVLLRNLKRASTEGELAKAYSLLAEFYRQVGFHWDVVRLLNVLETRYASAAVDNGLNGRLFVQKFSPNSRTLAELNQLRATRKLKQVAKITSSVASLKNSQRDVSSLFSQSRKSLSTPKNYPYNLSLQQTAGKNYLHVIERNDFQELGKMEVPLRLSSSEKKRQNFLGHFLPIGSVSQFQGFSMLEFSKGKQVWRTKPFDESGTDEMFQLGPAGPSFCCFQSRQRLVVVDPETGKILWQKNALEPFSGLWADSVSGLIGDENVLVLFDKKRSSFTVFRTTSGEIVRRGRLNIDSTKTRRVFGRLLFYFTRAPNDLRMRIWDPLKDENLLDEPTTSGYARTSVVRDDIVVLTPQRQLLAIDSTTGKIIFKKRFTEKEVQKIVYLEAFEDDERFYICLQQPSSNEVKQKRYHYYYVGNSPLASVHFWGDLLAFDRNTGRQLWKRSLSERSLFRTNDLKFPFLIFASRVGDLQQENKQTMSFEIIDSKNGKTLASIDHLELDRFYRVNYLVKRNRLEIVGTNSKVLFDLTPKEIAK